MCDENEDSKPKKQLNTSKELLYADFTGNTVVEHVLNSLQKRPHSTRSEEIQKFLKTKKDKSVAYERAKKLLSLMDENDKGSCLEASVDDKEAIEVHLTIGKEDPNVRAENYKADAWFILPQSKQQESEGTFSDLLDIDDNSSNSDSNSDSDSSQDEYLQNFCFSTEKKNLVIEDESSDHENECKPL